MKNGKFNMGRIHYFDPNVVSFENHEGTNSDSISYPLEDYSMAIDLLVRVYNRYSCGFGEVTNEFKDYRYSTNDGSLSFLGGTDGFLTTNFTDISLTQPEGNTTECLGIESINIEYQTYLHPVVNIRFVDVRGGTVMQPVENNYYDESKRGRSYQLYKAFFSMPYPLFILKVKGFYGKGISYRLTISKVDIEFDGTSGNFVFNVDFIGHLYGIFADLPMTYIAIAPYMDNGKEYWEKKISEGVFCFYGSDGNGGEVKQCDMMTFPKLALKLGQVAMSQPILENEAKSQKAMQDIDEEYAALNGLLESYPFKEDKFLYEEEIEGANQMAYQICFKENDAEFWGSVADFSSAISGYSETYYNGLTEKFGNLSEFCEKKDGVGKMNKNIKMYEFSVTDKEKAEFDDKNYKPSSFLKKKIVDRIKNEPGIINGKKFYVYVYTKGTTNNYGNLMENLSQRSQKLSEKKPDVEAEFKNEKNILIEQALGFKPSIRNIYNLAFAHLDTFLEVEYSMLKKIKEQLDTHQEQRKKESFDELRDEGGKYSTDTESMFLKTKNGDAANVRAQYLPPFTAYYRDIYDPSTSFYEDYNKGKTRNENYFDRGENKVSKRKELIWPGELSKGEDYLLETKLVTELLTAAKLYLKEAETVNEELERLKASGGTYDTNGYSPSTNTGLFIPLTTFDLANNGKYSNPYSYLYNRIGNNATGIEGDILFTFALRAFYYLSVNEDTRAEAESFGRIEAVNLFKAVGDEIINSKPFMEFIVKYGDEKGERGERNDFISYLVGESTKEGVTDSWIYGDKKSLFEKKGSKLVFNYIKGGSGTDYHFLPIGVQEPNAVKKDDSGMNCMGYDDCRYISTDDHKKFCSDREADKGSFVLIEDRDYLRTLISNFAAEATSVEETFEEREKEKEKNNGLDYGSRGTYDYKKLIYDSATLSHYRNNLETGEEQTKYFSKKMVESIEGKVSGDELAEELSVGNMENIFIKMPTRINGEGANSSLFDTPLYWLQDNIEAKAYLFVLSVPLLGKNSGLKIDESINGVVPKVALLREGAFYWWEENYNTDKVKVSGTVLGKKYNYRKPKRTQSFIVDYADSWGDNLDTLKPLSQNSVLHYSPIGKIENATLSRKKYLLKYFEDWANSEFSENEKYLSDARLYEGGKYDNGLNNTYLKNNIISSSDDIADKSYKLQKFLKNTLTSMCTTFDYYNGCYSEKGDKEISCSVNSMKRALNGFMEQLNTIYGDMVKDINENESNLAEAVYNANSQDPFRNKDLKLSTYMTLKSLYDKWICGSYKGEKTWRFNKTNMWEPQFKDSGYELDHFLYCDNFFHDIGYNLTVNLTKIIEWINGCLPTSDVNTTEGVMHVTGKTIYEFLTDVAQDCGGYLLAIPQRFIYSNPGSIEEAFKPFPTCQDWDDDTSTYMFLYTYKPSEHLGDSEENGDNTSIDMNGWSPDGDGFDLTNEDIVGELFCDNGFEVPAFGVTFAKQNQAYFKDIKLSTASHGVTEVGLNATFNIVSKASEAPRETTLYGQDIYKVYSNNSYQCTVEMMGNMQIFPPMYFQLNNIPLWKGAYLIQKVTHSIKPGDITTTIVGYRQNKYAIPMSDAEITVNLNAKSTDATDGSSFVGSSDSSVLSVGGVGNGSYNERNVKANPNKKLQYSDESDYNPTNITPQKPLICFTPAHSTVNGTIGKATENAWSAKLIDEYIIPRLKQKKFKDDTSYADNIHRCKTSNDVKGGYSLRETRELIEKYGSDCVISIVPHWNGLPSVCSGKTNTTGYFAVFYGKSFNGSPWKLRRDAAIFGAYARAACQKIVDNRASFKKLPIAKLPKSKDMINYVKQEKDGMFCYLLPAKSQEHDMSDPGAGLDCAHILTENFFPEYTSDMTTKWTSPDFDKQDENGRFVTGRGWLESPEGCGAIADVHVNAIVNYIESIGTNQNTIGSSGGYVSPGAPSVPIEGKTNTGLVEYCRAQIGRPYWWGGYGSRSTVDLLAWYRKTYPDQYSYTKTPKYETQLGVKVHDCVGLIKGYMWSKGPEDPNPKYNGNEFRDCTSDGLLNRSTIKGPISTIPEVPGLAVYMPGHVGVYIGGGKVIEAKGHAYGVVETNLVGRGWKNWSYIDGIKYT